MDTANLFYRYDENGEAIYYTDENCFNAFTGLIEESDIEAEVVYGVRKGVYKVFYQKPDRLAQIAFCEDNMITGLNIELFENGIIESVSLVINNFFFDIYEYDENGTFKSKTIWPNERKFPLITERDLKLIKEFREKYNLEKMNEEIINEGKTFDYGKYFRN